MLKFDAELEKISSPVWDEYTKQKKAISDLNEATGNCINSN